MRGALAAAIVVAATFLSTEVRAETSVAPPVPVESLPIAPRPKPRKKKRRVLIASPAPAPAPPPEPAVAAPTANPEPAPALPASLPAPATPPPALPPLPPDVEPVPASAAPLAAAPPSHEIAAPLSEVRAAPSVPAGVRVDLGARYRAFVVPAKVVELFARGGSTVFFHAVSAEAALRWRRFSFVPAVSYLDLRTPDMLVGDASGLGAEHFSHLRSDLRGVALSADLLFTTPLGASVDVELGVGVGAVAMFGELRSTWVHAAPQGEYAYGSARFARCGSVTDGVGCRPQDHAAPLPLRVGDHAEQPWASGSSVPPVLPWLVLPHVGVRIQASRDIALRVGGGASLAGLWLGVGAYFDAR